MQTQLLHHLSVTYARFSPSALAGQPICTRRSFPAAAKMLPAGLLLTIGLIVAMGLLLTVPAVQAQSLDCAAAIDFETDENGQAFEAGDRLDDSNRLDGITAQIDASAENALLIFDSANPSDADPDLVTPGYGPGNDRAEDNVLIISRDASVLDDTQNGGLITFVFEQATTISQLTLLDIDADETAAVRAFDAPEGGSEIAAVQAAPLGDNSLQELQLDASEARRLEVEFSSSGALVSFCGRGGVFGSETIPVELVALDAASDAQGVTLSWKTASETDNVGFYVARQTGEGLEIVSDLVEGAGTTGAPTTYRHRLTDLAPGTHVFRLWQEDRDGTRTLSDLKTEATVGIEGTFMLAAPYPNPFTRSATVHFTVERAQPVDVAVYDVRGRRVRTLYRGTPPAGEQQSVALAGAGLASGLYLMRLVGEDFTATRKVTLVK